MVLFFTILFTKLPLQPKPIYRFGRSTLQNKASEIVDIWKLLCEGVPWSLIGKLSNIGGGDEKPLPNRLSSPPRANKRLRDGLSDAEIF